MLACVGASAAGAASAGAATQVCAPSRPGIASCASVVQTGAKGTSERRISAAAGVPDAAPTGSGYGPADLQSAYALAKAAKADGGAATVAVVDAFNDPTAQSDLATYRAAWGLPKCAEANGCLRIINQNGQPSPLPTNATAPGTNLETSGWAAEESLDVDMVSAICPHCKIILAEADDAETVDLGTAVNAAVAAGAKYVSNSYSEEETGDDPSLDGQFFHHPGDVITASSDDEGFASGPQTPAAYPDVVAVGGTSLTRAANARGWKETAWAGAGAGCSEIFAKPSWQTDSGCSNRTIADVSADADPNTGVAVYDTFDFGGWVRVGGTSVSSPIIASVYALAGTPPAQPPRALYDKPQHLNDITTGNDGTCSPGYLCTAGIGYDGPTGLGTPNGIAAFTAEPVDTAAPAITGTPQDGVTLHGSKGTWTLASTLKFTLRWEGCSGTCTPIAGATTATFTPGPAQVGQTLELVVSATDHNGGTTTVTSPPTTTTVAGPAAPANLKAPAITGTASVGKKLTASTGKWASPDSLSFQVTWLSCDSTPTCVQVGTGPTYTVSATDLGHRIEIQVAATDQEAQSDVAVSKPTAIVK
jgi:hypothetical protein